MKRFLTHPLVLVFFVSAALYIIFGHVLQPPLPKSLLIQYMIICVIGILLVATFDDAAARRLAEPVITLLGHPKFMIARFIALVAVVAGVAGFTHTMIKPSLDAPIELRSVHPAPPSSIKVYGKTFDLLKLENPLRKKAPKGSAEFKALTAEGGTLYYKNCLYCHGDNLGGAGHFAKGFNPKPANFQDVGTIAQLQESYLFWRITTGGPGLPREGAPWASAMPVWHEMLTEDEVWKIILFLYDYTGHVPRSWELSEEKDTSEKAQVEVKGAGVPKGAWDEEATQTTYRRYCSHCHGEEGDGAGPVAEFMYPKPRDFTLGVFKYKTTHADDEFPTDADIRKTIENGLDGTAMPGWKGVLSDAEIVSLIKLIKVFGEWDEEEIEHQPIEEGQPVASSDESIVRGAKLFKKACVQCHGEKGRGNITSGKKLKDDWRNRIWPRNLTRPESWRVTRNAKDVFQRISGGIRGTPMPEHTTTMKIEDRWDIANYVMSLAGKAQPLARGETVIRAVRVSGDLPEKADDPAWEKAPPITFPFVPNIIKEPRLYFSLNETVTVRALFNGSDVVIRLDIDDRTFSVPGSEREKRYRVEGVTPAPDAAAIQLPAKMPATSEKPWFRHGNRKHGVNMWYWKAPGEAPESPEIVTVLDADGPEKAPRPREGETSLKGTGEWADGQWRIVMERSLTTRNDADLQFEPGKYIPIAFANWDGVSGEAGGHHSLTSWYWLLLEPEINTAALYGLAGGSGFLAGLIFLMAARRQRKQFSQPDAGLTKRS